MPFFAKIEAIAQGRILGHRTNSMFIAVMLHPTQSPSENKNSIEVR